MKPLQTWLLTTVLLLLPLLGCSTPFTLPPNASIDSAFVGNWKGKHLDKDHGILKTWRQERKQDGTYSIRFTYLGEDGKPLKSFTDSGYWWIEDGLFHEISPESMQNPEVYRYDWMGKDKVEFTAVKEGSDYSFVDTRITD